MKRFFAGLLIGLVGGIFALQNHVVRTNDGVIVIARTSRPPILTSYLDVRDWSASMWEQYPDVTTAVMKAGRTDLLTQNALGSFLNGEPAASKGTPATSTSSLMDAPLKFLQGTNSTSSYSSSGDTQLGLPANASSVLDQISTPPPAPAIPHELPVGTIPDTILGIPGSFPPQFQRADAALVLPQGRSASMSSQPEQVAPVPSVGPGSQVVPVPIQDRAAGQDPEWVRGLLRSLVPTEGMTTPASQGSTTGLSAPIPGGSLPPSAALDLLKTVTFEQPGESVAPIRAIRPF